MLISCLSLRRPKTTISLLPVNNVERYVDFRREEQLEHDQVKLQAQKLVASAGTNPSSTLLMNALQWVNELRLMCNHGPRDRSALEHLTKSKTKAEAQERFDQLERAGLAKCSNHTCGQSLSFAYIGEDHNHDDDPQISETLELLCAACHQSLSKDSERFSKVCNMTSRQTEVFNYGSRNDCGLDKRLNDGSERLPTKLSTLIQDIKETSPETKWYVETPLLHRSQLTRRKSVVFSAWIKTFKILEPRLREHSIRTVRLDGSLSTNSRDNVLRVFRTNPDIKCLLATITCGGVGLDLTAASRAYILEPQWNPMSEAQALDRIYRLGQKKEVTFVRYIMRGSFEENVVKLQRKKKDLADITVNKTRVSREELSAERLAWLKSLVS